MNGSDIVSVSSIHEGKLTIAGTGVGVADVLHLIAAGYTFRQVTESFPDLSTGNVRDALRYAAAVLEVLDLQRDSAAFTAANLALAKRDFDQQPPRLVQSRGTPWEVIMGLFGLMRGK